MRRRFRLYSSTCFQQILGSNNKYVAQLVNLLNGEDKAKNDRSLFGDAVELVPRLSETDILHATRKMTDDDVAMFNSLPD